MSQLTNFQSPVAMRCEQIHFCSCQYIFFGLIPQEFQSSHIYPTTQGLPTSVCAFTNQLPVLCTWMQFNEGEQVLLIMMRTPQYEGTRHTGGIAQKWTWYSGYKYEFLSRFKPMPGIMEELLGVCCPANVLRSDIPGAIAKSMLVTNTKEEKQDGGSTRHTTDEMTHNKSEKQWKFRQIHRSPRTNAQPLAHVMSTLHCLFEKLQ